MPVHCTFVCHLLHVSADFGHHQVDFTIYKKDSILHLSYLTFLQTEVIFRKFDRKCCKKLFYIVRN
jgi:hypothetical protein